MSQTDKVRYDTLKTLGPSHISVSSYQTYYQCGKDMYPCIFVLLFRSLTPSGKQMLKQKVFAEARNQLLHRGANVDPTTVKRQEAEEEWPMQSIPKPKTNVY